MTTETNLPDTTVLADTKQMIDSLKSVCANAGLANDSSEYKIITEAFLYKYLNDKFLHNLKKLDDFKNAEDVEAAYTAMTEEAREMVLLQLDSGTATIRPEYLLSHLFNRQNTQGFAELFDGALAGIADDNINIFAVKTGEGQSIKLFNGIRRYILEENKRDNFAAKIIDKLVTFSFERVFAEKYDFFATVFEYLITDYNKDSGTYGEFFTPHSIATIIAQILVPKGVSNVTVYDPAAGTGTLVLAAAHKIGEDKCTIYTQDRSQKANEFMRLNLILNNLVHSLPNVVNDDTLENPRHLEAGGKSIRKFDFIVSNPPFNADFSESRDILASENYRHRFWLGVPNVPPNQDKNKMPIYLMFLQHIACSLGEEGKAAIVVPTGFLSISKGIGRKFREYLIENNMLNGIVKMPPMVFANTGTQVSVLFLEKGRTDEEIILIDASGYGRKVNIDNDTQRTILSQSDIEEIVSLYKSKVEKEGISVLVANNEINEDYSFSPAHYFKTEIKRNALSSEEYKREMNLVKSKVKDSIHSTIGLDAAYTTLHTFIDQYEEIAELLFDRWFVDFEHPSIDASSMNWNEKLQANIPADWETKNIEEVCDVIDCLHSKKPDYCLEDERYFLLTLENVTTDGFIDLEKKFFVSKEDYQKWTRRGDVEEGDFVVTNAGRAGCIARIPKGVKCGISRNLTSIKPKEIGSLYLRQYLKSYWFKKQIATSLDEGSFFLSYNVKSIKRVEILMPPKALIDEFEEKLEKIIEKTPFYSLDANLSWLQ